MLHKLGLFSLIIGMLLCPYASAENTAFQPGEKLFFKVYWTAIQAGEATLEVLPLEQQSGVTAYHFVMTAKTLPLVDAFYKVRDRLDSYADQDMTHALLYRKQQDGKRNREITVVFDWQKSEAQYSEGGDKDNPIPLLPGAFDPLSVFYAFRLGELKENSEMIVTASDGKKCIAGKAKVIRKETVKVGGKKYETFLVEPELKDLGGVFRKSPDAKLQIWVTADERRIPVIIKSKVSVGSFSARLADDVKN